MNILLKRQKFHIFISFLSSVSPTYLCKQDQNGKLHSNTSFIPLLWRRGQQFSIQSSGRNPLVPSLPCCQPLWYQNLQGCVDPKRQLNGFPRIWNSEPRVELFTLEHPCTILPLVFVDLSQVLKPLFVLWRWYMWYIYIFVCIYIYIYVHIHVYHSPNTERFPTKWLWSFLVDALLPQF